MLSWFLDAIKDPMIIAGIMPNNIPPVGPSKAAIPPPVVKIGSPIVPRKRYSMIEAVALLIGNNNAVKIKNGVCNVIGIVPSGILINAPAAIRAVNSGVNMDIL